MLNPGDITLWYVAIVIRFYLLLAEEKNLAERLSRKYLKKYLHVNRKKVRF